MSYQQVSFRKLLGKRFTTVEGKELSWSVIEKDDKYSYERINQGSYRRVFFDLDMKLSKCPMEREVYEERVQDLMKACRQNCKTYDFAYTFGASYYNDTTEGKISTHIIFQNKYMSGLTLPEKSYLHDFIRKTVFDGMEESTVDYFLENEIVDMGVYGIEVFRMPMAKHEGKTVHQPDKNRPPTDYCVSYIPHCLRPEQSVTLYNEVNAQLNSRFKALTEEPAKETKKGRPPKVEAKELPNDTIIQIFLLLDAKKRAYAYKDWISLMLLCKTILGEEGLEVFKELSERSGYEDYDEKDVDDKYEKASPSGMYTMGTLIHWAKEDSPDELRALLSTTDHSGREDWDVVFISNKSSDSMIDLVKRLNGILVKDQRTRKIWYRDDFNPITPHRWVELEKQDIPTYLKSIIHDLKIATIKAGKEEGDPYQFVAVQKDLDWLEKNVWKYIDRYIPEELDIEDKFITSTHQKVCFQNGVYFCNEKVFRKWDEATPFGSDSCSATVKTAIVIPFPFANKTYKGHVNARRIFKSIFGKNYEHIIRKLARVYAGNSEDKQWMLGISMRDSAKSALQKILEYLFPGYTSEFETACIIIDTKSISGDGSRELAWLKAHRHRRLIIGQELPANSPNMKLNSKLLKKQSGGDRKSGRDCFEKHKDNANWVDNLTIMPLGNTQLSATTPDVFKNCFTVNFPRTFFDPIRDAHHVEEMKALGSWKDEIHAMANPIEFQKDYERHRDELIDFIFSMWQDKAVPCERLDDTGDIVDEEKSVSSSTRFQVLFATHFIKDPAGEMPYSDIAQFLLKHPLMSKLVFKKDIKAKLLELDGIKEDKHLGAKRTLLGVKGVRFVCNCSPDELELDQ